LKRFFFLKWCATYGTKERARAVRDIAALILQRRAKDCAFVLWKDLTILFKRYAGLYFVMAIDKNDNELITLEIIHRFVVTLDKMFRNVCVRFNF